MLGTRCPSPTRCSPAVARRRDTFLDARRRGRDRDAARAERPKLLVGAGTVVDAASLAAARERGARFALAPGFDRAILLEATRLGFTFAPGVMTPSELGGALAAGSRVCKYFPGGAAGGPTALAAIAAPFAHLSQQFLPTGGVTSENVASWLAVACVLAVGGTWIATTAEIEGERWDIIRRNAQDAVRRVSDARKTSSTA